MGCITSCVSRYARASPWTDLPPELLLEVSGRLQHAEDVVRFHAVCRLWHDAAALLAQVATRPCSCLPWVLTSCNNGQMVHSIINFRCSTETPTCRRGQGHFVLPNPSGAPPTNARNWVASVDAMAAWFFSDHPEPRLVDVHTGAVTRLPPLPDKTKMAMDNFRGGGGVYKDGTVFLYSFGSRPRWYSHRHEPAETDFTAAIMCPGEAAWTTLKRRMDLLPQSYAMYHDGKVLV